MIFALALAMLAATPIPSTPDLGTAEASCRAHEDGPAILIDVEGLKDRTGTLKAELFPPDQADFLADDNVLVAAGKTFRRVRAPIAQQGPVTICIRVPAPGVYTLALTHDRDGKPKFNFWTDGIGFPGNPRLGHAAPPASQARISVGRGVTMTAIRLNYRHGVLSFGPLE